MNLYFDDTSNSLFIVSDQTGIAICDLNTRKVWYTIVPKKGKKVEIWGRENNFLCPLYVGDWNGALNWFGV